jgi:hypothetical protein
MDTYAVRPYNGRYGDFDISTLFWGSWSSSPCLCSVYSRGKRSIGYSTGGSLTV